MDKKYLISIILLVIVVIAILLIAGMNLGNFNKQTNNTTNITNNTTNNNTINVTHLENNTDGKSSNGNSKDDSSRYREVRDKEYLGDEVVYEDTATGKYYYKGQEMNYEKLADDYNREHKVGPYAQS